MFGVVLFERVLNISFASLAVLSFKVTDGVDFLLETLLLGGLRFLPEIPLLLLLLFVDWVDSTENADVDAFFEFFLAFAGCLATMVEGETALIKGLTFLFEYASSSPNTITWLR